MDDARTRNPLPEGTLSVGAGLLVAGVTAYGFLVVSGRALGPERYAALSGLWFLGFFAGPGFFLPLEQEVARALAARHAQGVGGGPIVRRAALAGAVLAIVLVAVSLAASRPLLNDVFDHEGLLLVGFALTLAGYFLAHLTRGTLSGNGRFGPYGTLLGAEGLTRLVGCLVFFVVGVHRAGPYGLMIGIAPMVAVAVSLARERGLVTPGPDAPWSELSTKLGYLLAGSALAQLLVNAAPLAAKVLATKAETKVAGTFIAGVIIARVPVFLFQAVQAALLPKLAGLAGAGRVADFRAGLRRLLIVVAAIGIVATAGALAVGPWALRLLFGAKFAGLGHGDLGYLAAANGAFMLALTLAQALIALNGHARAALAWILGVLVFVIVVALGHELLPRVEHGFLAGAAIAAAAMYVELLDRMRSGVPTDTAGLVHAIEQEFVEP
jgi:O-antigen/teichoic acid export membrane protein